MERGRPSGRRGLDRFAQTAAADRFAGRAGRRDRQAAAARHSGPGRRRGFRSNSNTVSVFSRTGSRGGLMTHARLRALITVVALAAAPLAGVAATAPPAAALDNGLALTPQMGFNDWNAYGCNVSE